MPSNDDILNVYSLVSAWADTTEDPNARNTFHEIALKLSQVYRRNISGNVDQQISTDLLNSRQTKDVTVTAVAKTPAPVELNSQ